MEWVAVSTLRDLPDPGTKPASLVSSTSSGGFLTTESPGKQYF